MCVNFAENNKIKFLQLFLATSLKQLENNQSYKTQTNFKRHQWGDQAKRGKRKIAH